MSRAPIGHWARAPANAVATALGGPYDRDMMRDTSNACSYCQRTFGSQVTWKGRPVYLRKEREHVIPKAAGGTATLPACHICNRVKGSLVFETIGEIQNYCLDALHRDGSVVLVAKPLSVLPSLTCQWCSKDFVSSQPSARHCTDDCRSAAWEAAHPRLTPDKAQALAKLEKSREARRQRYLAQKQKAAVPVVLHEASCGKCAEKQQLVLALVAQINALMDYADQCPKRALH